MTSIVILSIVIFLLVCVIIGLVLALNAHTQEDLLEEGFDNSEYNEEDMSDLEIKELFYHLICSALLSNSEYTNRNDVKDIILQAKELSEFMYSNYYTKSDE